MKLKRIMLINSTCYEKAKVMWMRKKETIEDRLDRISKEFDTFCNQESKSEARDNLNSLMHLGLTKKEAKSWLKHEPNFPSDASYHEPQNGREVTRTSTEV